MVELLPIFENNYLFVIRDPESKDCVIVDPGEASSVLNYITENNLNPLGVLITHHHRDHTDGLSEVLSRWNIPAYAPLKEKNYIRQATDFVSDNQELILGSFHFQVIELPGHTLGHVAYYASKEKNLFSGDVIFGLGCGRLFEETPEQAFQSLQRIKALPPDTLIYCSHEYTEQNLIFCKALTPLDGFCFDQDDDDFENYEEELARSLGRGNPSVPLLLEKEIKSNPFLLANSVTQFAALRELRNRH